MKFCRGHVNSYTNTERFLLNIRFYLNSSTWSITYQKDRTEYVIKTKTSLVVVEDFDYKVDEEADIECYSRASPRDQTIMNRLFAHSQHVITNYIHPPH